MATSGQAVQHFLDSRELVLIGRGGRGSVYANPTYPSRVAKVARRYDTCRGWYQEYELVRSLEAQLDALSPLPLARLIRFLDYHQGQGEQEHCAILMERVLPPISQGPTWQAYLNLQDENKWVEGRGLYLGRDQLVRYLPHSYTLYDLVFDLGALVARLHYVCKVDATDVEYVFGHMADAPLYNQLFALDFDLCQRYDTPDVKTLSWSLSSEEYFPQPSGDPHLWIMFREAYVSTAALFGARDTALAVMDSLV